MQYLIFRQFCKISQNLATRLRECSAELAKTAPFGVNRRRPKAGHVPREARTGGEITGSVAQAVTTSRSRPRSGLVARMDDSRIARPNWLWPPIAKICPNGQSAPTTPLKRADIDTPSIIQHTIVVQGPGRPTSHRCRRQRKTPHDPALPGLDRTTQTRSDRDRQGPKAPDVGGDKLESGHDTHCQANDGRIFHPQGIGRQLPVCRCCTG